MTVLLCFYTVFLSCPTDERAPKIGPKGYTGSGKSITTKHDKVICGRKNAERLMEVGPVHLLPLSVH